MNLLNMIKFRRLFLIICSATSVFICIQMISNTPHMENSLDPTVIQANESVTKTVLFWTTYFEKKFHAVNVFDSCPTKCRLSTDRSSVNQSDAVLFHMHRADFRADDTPLFRRPHQRYVAYIMESPVRTNRQTCQLAARHFFNWTMTYRRDSDIFNTFQHGAVRLKPEPERAAPSLDDYYGVNVTGKQKMAAWFVTHCRTSVRREAMVRELQRHMAVDVFGSCGGPFKCPKSSAAQCDAMLRGQYLFYLSLENSLCPDYVTEKLFHAFDADTVPVVFGGADYSAFAPPHSYINALDFESPRQLAAYLIQLSQNRELYSHYFQWKRLFQVDTKPRESWCRLCSMLHDDTLPTKSYESIAHWWFVQQPCQNYQWKSGVN